MSGWPKWLVLVGKAVRILRQEGVVVQVVGLSGPLGSRGIFGSFR